MTTLTNMTTGKAAKVDATEPWPKTVAAIARLTVLTGHPIGVNRADIREAATVIAKQLPQVLRDGPQSASIAFADAMNLLDLDVTA